MEFDDAVAPEHEVGEGAADVDAQQGGAVLTHRGGGRVEASWTHRTSACAHVGVRQSGGAFGVCVVDYHA